MSPATASTLVHSARSAVKTGIQESLQGLMPSRPVIRAVSGGTTVLVIWALYTSVRKHLALIRIEEAVSASKED
jgi:hypothetical protein